IFYDQLLERVKAVPGVKGAATINILHIVPSGSLLYFAVEGMPPRQLAQYPIGQSRGVSPNYFDLMNIPIRSGRGFQDSDLAENAQHCLLINETMARSYFRNESPIGKKIIMVESPKYETWSIIGVAADVKDLGVDREPQPEMYFPGFNNNGVLLVHTAVAPRSLTPAIRQIVKSIDPYQPLGQVRTMREVLDDSLSTRRFPVSLMTLFSVLALVL